MTLSRSAFSGSDNVLSKKLATALPFLIASNVVQVIIDTIQVLGRHHVLRQRQNGEYCAVILDVAHNEDSARQLSRLIRTYSFNTCHIVAGMLKRLKISKLVYRLFLIFKHIGIVQPYLANGGKTQNV